MSYTSLTYHVIFSTKERRPILAHDLMPRLVQYLGGMFHARDGRLIEANGPEDHIHLVASLSPKFSLSEVMRDIKANASNWVHETLADKRDFAWQEGYAAFSVSLSAVDDVVRYVQNQQSHHRKKTFQEELIEFLERHGIQYDPKYLI